MEIVTRLPRSPSPFTPFKAVPEEMEYSDWLMRSGVKANRYLNSLNRYVTASLHRERVLPAVENLYRTSLNIIDRTMRVKDPIRRQSINVAINALGLSDDQVLGAKGATYFGG